MPGQACFKQMSTVYLVKHLGETEGKGSPGFSYTLSVQYPSLEICSQTPSQSQRDKFRECFGSSVQSTDTLEQAEHAQP